MDAGIDISMDGRGRALDNIFVERRWRTVKYEDLYIKGAEPGKEKKGPCAALFSVSGFSPAAASEVA